MAMTGLSSGSSTCQKICQRLAPITRAARMGSRGSPASPETKTRKVNAVHCHTSAPMTASLAAV